MSGDVEPKERLTNSESKPFGGKSWNILCRVFVWLAPFLCSCIFLPCVTYSEWYVDELFAVLRNEDARGESPLWQVFTNDFWGNPLRGGQGSWTHKSYRPLSVLSFAWQFNLLDAFARNFKLLEEGLFRPQPLRAFNVALHSANSLLVYFLLQSGLRLSSRWSCLAACLFAAHPVHVENIIYLVGRADMLATTGWLVAAIVQLQMRRSRLLDASAKPFSTVLLLSLYTFLAVFAGLCKESGLTLLVFVAGVELCGPRRAAVKVAFSALALFALVAVIRFQITQGSSAAFGFVDTPIQYQESKLVRTLSYLLQHAFYSKLLVFPGQLSWDYSYDALPVMRSAFSDVRMLGILIFYLAICSLAAWGLSGTGRRRIILGLQHVIIPFVPASNLFFTVGVTIGERLLYPSTVGFSIILASLGETFDQPSSSIASSAFAGKVEQRPSTRRLSRPTRTFMLGLLLLSVYIWRCGVRVWQWHSSEALYAADAAAWPRSVKTRHQLGTIFHAQSRYAEALQEYEASLALLDDNALTDFSIAQIFVETGRYGDAVARFEKIFRGHLIGFSRSNLWMLYVDYGFTLVALGRFEEAIQPLNQGLGFNLALPHGLNALGYAHANLQQLQEAQDAFAKGLEYDPENPVLWSNLGVVWMIAGVFQQAAQALEKALTMEPDNPVIVHNVILLKAAVANGGVIQDRPRLDLFFSRIG